MDQETWKARMERNRIRARMLGKKRQQAYRDREKVKRDDRKATDDAVTHLRDIVDYGNINGTWPNIIDTLGSDSEMVRRVADFLEGLIFASK